MDDHDDGTEYSEYKSSSGWTGEMYRWRLSQTGKIIKEAGYPDIIILNEIENEQVVKDLCKGPLKFRGYNWYAVKSAENGPISTAILSKFAIKKVRIHSVEGCRPVIEAEIEGPEEPLFVLACHGKSNLGGKKETEAKRLALSKTLNYAAERIKRDNQNAAVVAAGDFNGSVQDSQLLNGEQPAIVEKGSNNIAEENGSLVVSGVKGRECWYSPWLDSSFSSFKGSYWWSGSWEDYDSVYCSPSLFDDQGMVFSDFEVITCSANSNADGTPRKWERNLLDGISDHFPVKVTLQL